MQWNLNGYYNNYIELKQLITDYQPNIIALQETHLKPSHSVSLKGYSVNRYDDQSGLRAKGGTLLFIQSSLYHTTIPLQTDLQAVSTRIIIQNLNLTICNLYIPPDSNPAEEDFLNLIKQLPHPFILVGDFNAHSDTWGCTNTNSKGKIIEKILNDDPNICLMNNGLPTHITTSTGNTSIIDLTLASSTLAPLLQWNTHPDPCNSDHFPILINALVKSSTHSPQKIINFKKANWEQFSKSIKFDSEISNPLDRVQNIYDVIRKAQNAAIPTSNIKPKSVPWWNNNIAEAIIARKKALRIFTKIKSNETKIEYKKARAKVRYLTKKAKTETWQKFVSSINTSTPTNEIWEKINKIRNKNSKISIPAIISNNKLITKEDDITEAFATHFEKISSDDFLDSNTKKRKMNLLNPDFSSDNTEPYNSDFSLDELKAAIAKIKKNTPGPDNLYPETLKHIPTNELSFILTTFNKLWQNDVLPSKWKQSIIIPIPKPDKNNLELHNYRPISITSPLSKIFERMVTNRLQWILENNSLLSDNQYGFRKKKSIADVHTIFTNEINNAFINKQHVIAIFFDIYKAFDCLWKNVIMHQIHKWNLRGHLPLFIQNFLIDRNFQVKINNNYSNIRHLLNGIPQGSVISPTLFQIAINSLSSFFQPPVQHLLYADDLLIYVRTSNLKYAEHKLQTALNKLHEWASNNGLNFTPDKTVCINFNRLTKPVINNPVLKLNNIILEFKSEKRFLGLKYDHKLSWKGHISDIKAKCNLKLNLMKVISKQNWGADRNSLLKIYKTTVLSVLDFGCQIYNSASNSLLKKLDPIHHLGIRLSSGAYHSSPVLSICSEAGELPLKFRRKLLCLNLTLNTASQDNHPIRNNIITPQYQSQYNKQKRIKKSYFQCFENIKIDQIMIHIKPIPPPWIKNKIQIIEKLHNLSKETTHPLVYQHEFLDLLSHYPDFIPVFTDGSKRNNNVSCAYLIDQLIQSFNLPNQFSVYSAELYAILMALNDIKGRSPNKYLICTDSWSAVSSLKIMDDKDNPILTEIINTVFSLNNQFSIYFIWIPGHCGIPGNERVDEEAKKATLRGDPSVLTNIPLPDAKNHYKKAIIEEWENIWINTPSNKLRKIKQFTKKMNTSSQQLRRNEIVLARLRIGHTNLTHSHIRKKENPTNCDECNILLSIEHILLTCPKYRKVRNDLNLPNSLEEILKDDEQSVAKVLKFLDLTNLKDKI